MENHAYGKKIPIMDAETKFLCALLELQYGQLDLKAAQQVAADVPWAKGWPKERKAFWNGEAFLWTRKISQEKRLLIEKELSFLRRGRNLDLGCGAWSYLPSVGFDLSEQMLLRNDQCTEKIVGDLEKSLPFSSESFDSVTAVFVLNYVKNADSLLRDIFRVLKNEGFFVAILSEKGINAWQQQHQTQDVSPEEWKRNLEEVGFKVHLFVKERMVFLRGEKRRLEVDVKIKK